MSNPFGKSVKTEQPYAVYKGPQGFEWRVLKTRQKPKNDKANLHSLWFVAAKSDMTFGSFELGDTYANDILKYGILVECTSEWYNHYAEVSQVAPGLEISE